jgi:uncharacterized membrane protein (DUF4010 family)
MIVRVLVVASSLNVHLLVPLLWPLGAAAFVLLVVTAVLFFVNRGGATTTRPEMKISTPFDLGTALKLAGLIAVISLVAKWLIATIGESALTILAALSGVADVDAITLSLARLARENITIVTATESIAIAVAVNTVIKAGMTFGLGTSKVGWIVAGASAAAIGAGTAAFLVFS